MHIHNIHNSTNFLREREKKKEKTSILFRYFHLKNSVFFHFSFLQSILYFVLRYH